MSSLIDVEESEASSPAGLKNLAPTDKRGNSIFIGREAVEKGRV